MSQNDIHAMPPAHAHAQPERHPRALAPGNLILTIILSILGAIIGIQLLASLGITPSTSLIGALAAMALARIPLRLFQGFRSIHAQNLAQTSISSATFGAANTLFLPIGILRWSRKFGPVVKVDRMRKVTIQNEKTKKPFA